VLAQCHRLSCAATRALRGLCATRGLAIRKGLPISGAPPGPVSAVKGWAMFGLVQRTCSLAKFERLSASLATTLPSSTAALGWELVEQLRAMEGKRSVKSYPLRL
jgi:hypothetical protein